MKAHFSIEQQFPDAINSEEDMETLMQHEDAVETAITLATKLIALSIVHTYVAELMVQIIDLQCKKDESPNKSCDKVSQEVTEDFKKLQKTLKRSTVSIGHRIRRMVMHLLWICISQTVLHLHWTLTAPVQVLSNNKSSFPNYHCQPSTEIP